MEAGTQNVKQTYQCQIRWESRVSQEENIKQGALCIYESTQTKQIPLTGLFLFIFAVAAGVVCGVRCLCFCFSRCLYCTCTHFASASDVVTCIRQVSFLASIFYFVYFVYVSAVLSDGTMSFVVDAVIVATCRRKWNVCSDSDFCNCC